MEKNLKEILSEIKRIMYHDNPKIISEQDPDVLDVVAPVAKAVSGAYGAAAGFIGECFYSNSKEGVCYRQQFEPWKGYFDNAMMLGECFDITVFDGSNANAYDSMNIDKDKIFKDDNGYYINGASFYETEKIQPIRIYLPKDEFFRGLLGVVKSFVAYETCSSQKEKKGGKKYFLVYQLNDPGKATLQRLVNADGTIEADIDPSRGWIVSIFGGSQSGYFRNKAADEYTASSRELVVGDFYPESFSEYSLDNYSKEYGKSDFDVWYDSGWGTAIQIGGAIIVGVLSGGLGGLIAGGLGLTAGVAEIVVLATELIGEFAIAIPEAIYLKNRGMNGASTLVLLCALLPVFNRLGFVKRAAGILTDSEIEDLVGRINKEAGGLQTPGDIKQFIKNLKYKDKQFLEKFLQDAVDSLPKLKTQQLIADLQTGLKKIVSESVSKATLTATIKSSASKILKGLPKNWGPSLRLIGINLGAVIGSMPIIFTVVDDDEEFINDPQGILDSAEKNAQRIHDSITEETGEKAAEIGMELEKDMLDAPESEKFQKTLYYIQYLKDLGDLGKIQLEEYRTDAFRNLLKMTLRDIEEQIALDFQEGKYQEAKKRIDTYNELVGTEAEDEYAETRLKKCSDLEIPQFSTYDEACAFLNWVVKTYPNAEWQFVDDDVNRSMEYLDCEELTNQFFSQEFIMKSCHIRHAYKNYWNEYSKLFNIKQVDTKTSVSKTKFCIKNTTTGIWEETTKEKYIEQKKLDDNTVKVKIDGSDCNS